MSDKCERCGNPTVKRDERYCKECRKDVLAELREAGYLAPILPPSGISRTPDQRENTYETKHGPGQR